MIRLPIAAALAALALACAPRPRTAPPSAPERRLFEPRPAAEVAAVKDPHDVGGEPLCQRCHHLDGRLTAAPGALCLECHPAKHGSHPVDVVQKAPVKDLPLLAGGRVACHTCHDPHQGKRVLRKPFNELCRTCHRGH
jgi:predicted CXXCH cytochrome family protein